MEYSEALDHVDRNGNLLWVRADRHEVERAFARMKREGHIERNAVPHFVIGKPQ